MFVSPWAGRHDKWSLYACLNHRQQQCYMCRIWATKTNHFPWTTDFHAKCIRYPVSINSNTTEPFKNRAQNTMFFLFTKLRCTCWEKAFGKIKTKHQLALAAICVSETTGFFKKTSDFRIFYDVKNASSPFHLKSSKSFVYDLFIEQLGEKACCC